MSAAVLHPSYVFCPTPRTGSTAIEVALCARHEGFTKCIGHHPKVDVIARQAARAAHWFTVIRNPYDVLVTWWLVTRDSSKLGYRPTFINWLTGARHQGHPMIVDGELLWYRRAVIRRGGTVLRYEAETNSRLNELLGFLRVPCVELGQHNVTKQKTRPWRDYYDADCLRVVRLWLGAEIDDAGYQVL